MTRSSLVLIMFFACGILLVMQPPWIMEGSISILVFSIFWSVSLPCVFVLLLHKTRRRILSIKIHRPVAAKLVSIAIVVSAYISITACIFLISVYPGVYLFDSASGVVWIVLFASAKGLDGLEQCAVPGSAAQISGQCKVSDTISQLLGHIDFPLSSLIVLGALITMGILLGVCSNTLLLRAKRETRSGLEVLSLSALAFLLFTAIFGVGATSAVGNALIRHDVYLHDGELLARSAFALRKGEISAREDLQVPANITAIESGYSCGNMRFFRHGPYIAQLESGIIIIECSFEYGRLDGEVIYNFTSGLPKVRGYFDAGRRNGEWTIYTPSGHVHAEGSFVNGKPAEPWKYYYPGVEDGVFLGPFREEVVFPEGDLPGWVGAE